VTLEIQELNVYINYIVNRTWISNVTINNDNVYINYIVNRTWISNVTIDNDNVYIMEDVIVMDLCRSREADYAIQRNVEVSTL
jgi:acetyltransferase-like isoleucine patch superfamily enzyme